MNYISAIYICQAENLNGHFVNFIIKYNKIVFFKEIVTVQQAYAFTADIANVSLNAHNYEGTE